MQFTSKTPHFEYLHQKWTAKSRNLEESLWSKHTNAIKHFATIGSLGGLMLISAPSAPLLTTHNLIASTDDVVKSYDQNVFLAEDLKDKLPSEVQSLDSQQEKDVTELFSKSFGFKTVAELGGIRLPRNYGRIGAEQHLYRYPGDNLHAHAENSSDWALYGAAGIAPHLGAWGYFAQSKEEFKEIDKLRERYYLAIQTFLVPGYAEDPTKYRDFFKFRKMVVVNPQTGQAVVAVVADAGPSVWTGKHLGGSPEVMQSLGMNGGPMQGKVLYFFIDDPGDTVPLGPVKVQSQV